MTIIVLQLQIWLYKDNLCQNRHQNVFNKGGFAFLREGLTLKKMTKTQLIYSVSCFNLGGLGV